MTLSVGKIGLNTQKISFGKGGKGCSSSYRSRYINDDKGCSSCDDNKGNTTSTSCVKSRPVSTPKPVKITREELFDRLETYRDDPVMFKIIMDQLRRLG